MSYTFECTTDEPTLRRQVSRCREAGKRRFNHRLTNQFSTKCFDALAIDEYLAFMTSKLRKRRLQLDYVHRTTNRPRNKTAECIWDDANAETRDMVLKILTEVDDAVDFCDACIGSENDLLRGLTRGVG